MKTDELKEYIDEKFGWTRFITDLVGRGLDATLRVVDDFERATGYKYRLIEIVQAEQVDADSSSENDNYDSGEAGTYTIIFNLVEVCDHGFKMSGKDYALCGYKDSYTDKVQIDRDSPCLEVEKFTKVINKWVTKKE